MGARDAAARRGERNARPRDQRWLVVAGLFTVTFTLANAFAAFGVFLPVLAQEFGWSRGAISVALSINFVVGGASGFAVGTLADRYGPARSWSGPRPSRGPASHSHRPSRPCGTCICSSGSWAAWVCRPSTC